MKNFFAAPQLHLAVAVILDILCRCNFALRIHLPLWTGFQSTLTEREA
jgi:hypothetical protein